MKRIAAALLIVTALFAALPAEAQTPATVKLCIPTTGTVCPVITAANPLPITGTITASLAGFTPNGNYGTLTATNLTSASTALPAGTVVAFQNLSSVDVSCVLTNGASTATTNKLIVRAGATVYYTIGANTTTACINQTGSASNVIGLAGGTGLGTAFGGASSGGGGGGAVTMASGAVASGAYSAGSIAAGAYVSGSILSGALASGAVVDLTNLSTPVAANTATATKGILLGGQFDTTQKTLTNGQQAALSASPRGALYVATGAENLVVVGAGTAGSASGGVITVQGSASGTAIPVSGTVTATPTGTQAVSIASAQVASGAVASGAIASGALASGSGTDGWNVTQGAKADSVCGTATGTCSEIALLKFLNTSVTSPVPVNVNTTATALTGLTPGVAQTGTIIAANMDMTSLGGVAFGAMANYGTSPGAVKVAGTNAFVTNFGTGTAGSAAGGVVTVQGVASMTPVLSNPGTAANWGVGATGSAAPANGIYSGVLDAVGGTNMVGLAGDPCQTSVKTTVPITLATAAVKVIVTGVSAKKIYVCSFDLNNNAADTVAVFEATTATTCATSAIAVIGAGTSVATAGTGYNFAANGGIAKGNGASQILQTTVNNNDLCIAQSAATQLSGSITYVTR